MLHHYKALGVPVGASSDEIYRAYRRLAKKYHPDSQSSFASPTKFRWIKESFDQLKDPENRCRFEACWKAMEEIDRFQALGKTRQEQMVSVGNGGFIRQSDWLDNEKTPSAAQVIPFPRRKESERTPGISKLIFEYTRQQVQAVLSAVKAVSERRSDQRLRELTTRLNRIPESEIGLR